MPLGNWFLPRHDIRLFDDDGCESEDVVEDNQFHDASRAAAVKRQDRRHLSAPLRRGAACGGGRRRRRRYARHLVVEEENK